MKMLDWTIQVSIFMATMNWKTLGKLRHNLKYLQNAASEKSSLTWVYSSYKPVQIDFFARNSILKRINRSKLWTVVRFSKWLTFLNLRNLSKEFEPAVIWFWVGTVICFQNCQNSVFKKWQSGSSTTSA